MSRSKYWFLSFLFFFSFYVHSAVRLTGDGSDVTFTSTIGPHVYDVGGDTMYIGAGAATASNTYAIASAKSITDDGSTPAFTALAPATVELNGTANTANPLYAKQITYIDLFGGLPVAVTADQVTNVYLMNAVSSTASDAKVISAESIKDAGGTNVTNGIVGLVAGLASTNYVFVAVAPNGGNFGATNSGVALLKETWDASNLVSTLDILNAQTGVSSGNTATALDVSSSALAITNDLASVNTTTVVMHYNEDLQRLYVGMHVTGNSDVADGARSVAVGRVQDDTLIFNTIALDAVMTSNNKIIGATGASEQLSVHKLRTLQTSTKLHYLIVVGGNGADGTTGNTVYALPLVNKLADYIYENRETAFEDPSHGTLAKFDSTPTEKFSQRGDFIDRGFTTTAQAAADLLTASSAAAQVGGGALSLASTQTITDIVARHDSVIVTIGDDFDGTTEAGAFASTAILDNNGRIAEWTPWRRVGGTDQKLFGIEIARGPGYYWLFPAAAADLVDTVSVTRWGVNDMDGLYGGTSSDASVGLARQLQTEFPQSTLGIHNMFDFARTTSGFGDLAATANNQLSMLAVVGGNKVVLAETGRNGTSTIFRANSGDFSTGKQTFTNGTLTGFSVTLATKILSMTGGVLNNIGPIMAAEVSRTPLSGSTTSGYLFVGGVGGLAVLSEADNTGWDTAASGGGLHARFDNLTSTMSFKEIGDYSFIRKLVSDGTYLYILTHNKLDRLTLSTVASGSPTVVTLATSASGLNKPDYILFSDFGVSNKFGLLATSIGLFRVGNDQDITDGSITGPSDLSWTEVYIPEGIGAVSRLFFLSPTTHETGFALNGMVYVLSGFAGYNEARVNRFFVSDVSSTAISDSTILPLPDRFFGGVNSFFYEFGDYRNFISYDGIHLFHSKSSFNGATPLLQSLYTLCGGHKYAPRLLNATVVAQLGSPKIASFASNSPVTIQQLIVDSASGSSLLSGDFGMITHE